MELKVTRDQLQLGSQLCFDFQVHASRFARWAAALTCPMHEDGEAWDRGAKDYWSADMQESRFNSIDIVMNDATQTLHKFDKDWEFYGGAFFLDCSTISF